MAALAGNLLVALTKAGAAAWTGSAAMLSEAVHSFVDTGNEVLLLYGMHRAARPPDRAHPLGYGRELYFWSFIVALLIFALGAAISIYEGVTHVLRPEGVRDPLVNYIVLGLATVFEGASWWVALRQFRATKGTRGYYEAFRRSKDPPSFMVLFEDSAAMIGIALAALGVYASSSLGLPVLDGVASILIGLMLAAISILLARESKSLLIGERADGGLAASILQLAAAHPGIEQAHGIFTIHLAPHQIVAALNVSFADTLCAREVERAVSGVERQVQSAHPDVIALFIKPQTRPSFHAAGGPDLAGGQTSPSSDPSAAAL